MTPAFHVGEIVIIAISEWPELVGEEATISGPYAVRRGRSVWGQPASCFGYEVTLSDGDVFSFPPHYLRKRKPPREDLAPVRWSECPWRPAKEGTPA